MTLQASSPPFSSDTKFQALLESAPDAIVIVDGNGQICIVNTQVERLFGYTRTELLGQPVEVLLPEALRGLHERHRARYLVAPHTRAMGNGLDLVARRKNGSTFPVEISLSSITGPEGVLVTSVIRDISERKATEAALARQSALLREQGRLLELAHDAIIVRDPQDKILFWNHGAEELYGWTAAEALGRSTHHLLHTHFPVSRADVEATLLAQERWDGELVHRRRDDTRVVVASRQVLRRDEQGVPVAILEINSDITARAMTLAEQVTMLEEQQSALKERLTAAEAAMLQAARLAAVGQLAAAIAHEINNPLYAARNCLYLIEQDLPPPLRDGPYFSLARDQLARIARIIERMRDFYRPARGELAPHDLNQLLEETLALTGLNTRYAAISVVFEPQRDLQPVVANGDQLRQVFLNLILNALDAMDTGGTLTIRTVSGPTVALAEIVDTGVGIPPDVRERLFEPFFTTKSNGTGLGLSISAHIVTQHGGQIDVESSPGQGSTFRVVLPYQQAQ